MKSYLKNKRDISQWFMDTTYYDIPRNNNCFKLLLILGFNIKEDKTVIGSIILIKKENQETFIKSLNYLHNNNEFNPEIINIDCSVPEILVIKKVFIECRINICYYHLLKKFIQHLPQIRSNNLNEKNNAKNLLSNMKILLFKKEIKKYFELKFYVLYSLYFCFQKKLLIL